MGRAAELPSGTVTFLVCVADRAKARSRTVAQRDVDAVLAQYGGIEVPVPASAGRAAVFANARGAAAAAVELRRGAGFRLGIHSGDAAPGRGGYRGAAAEHAPRVAAAAQPGQVLVTAAAAALLEGALPPAERLRPLGEVALPDAGKEPLFELLPGGGAGGLRRLPERPLLDREAELATLVRLVESARRGDGGLVLVEGSAGIGKTRLLTETRTFAADGMRVLVARGGEFEGDFVFGVVRQLFEPLLATVPVTVRAELLSGAAELAAPLFEASSLVERPDAESDGSFAMLHGLYWLAANVAYTQPTLLSIDDLHWADSASLRWLCYLARRLEGLPLLVAGSTRPPEQARDPELLTELLAD